MIAQSRVTGMLLSFICHMPLAAARGSWVRRILLGILSA